MNYQDRVKPKALREMHKVLLQDMGSRFKLRTDPQCKMKRMKTK